MNARVAVLYAPGTNCHEETIYALTEILGIKTKLVLVDGKGKLSSSLKNFSGLVLPGGFSFGDHFGAGRILSLIVRERLGEELNEFARQQKQILGICNGFQVLTETSLLPGSLLRNASAKFESRWVKIQTAQFGFSRTEELEGKTFRLPVAHGEGRYVWKDELVFPLFSYVSEGGSPPYTYWYDATSYPDNPAGAMSSIAGLTDKSGNILGMMPHPERAVLPAHKSQDGVAILKAFLDS